MNSTIAPIGLYTWRRWNDSQSHNHANPHVPSANGDSSPSANNNNS